MATQTEPLQQSTLRRFTVDDLYRMAEAGIFDDEERIELLDGVIVVMPSPGDPHVDEVNSLTRVLPQRLGDRAWPSVQNPLLIGPYWQPLPDFCLVRPGTRGRPRPEDVLLVIEVADTSLAGDRDVKIPAYGRAGIIEAWLVDVNALRLLVFRDPSPEGYRSFRSLGPGDSLTLAAFPDVELAVADLLPPAP